MPKKRKQEAEAEQVNPSEVREQISQRKLKALLKTANEAYKDGRELAGTLGQKIGNAVEHDNLHRKAFSTLRAMDRMTPEKLADYWDTLQYYVDVSGLGERAASAPRLEFDAGEDEDGGDEEESNVHHLSTAAE